MASPRRISERQVLALVRRWAKRLHLTDWRLRVQVAPIPDEEDARAYCAAQPEYREAVIAVDPSAVTPADLEATVCHELIHCQTESLAALALFMAGDDPVRREAVRRAEEELVMRLERVVRDAYKEHGK